MVTTTSSKCVIDDCNHAVAEGARFCSRGCRNIGWIEENLRVPDGKLVGKSVKLLAFQRKALRGIYNSITRRAIMTFGRKNGKTGLSAMILLLHLCGPEARVNTELNSSAMSRDQASILHRLAGKMVRLNPQMSEDVIVRDTVKQLACPRLGTLYTALSADAATNFGLSPALIVHDELGQVIGPRHDLYDALETATGAHENPLSIIISTQAPTDGDLLSILIDDALEGKDPETKVFLYTADTDDDPFVEETIKKANPAFGIFQSAKETLAMADAAKRMPSREAKYRNLILNQRVEASNPFVTQTVWRENEGTNDGWGVAYAGLDLSETNDLTAFVLVSPVNGIFNMEATFWLPGEGLEERSRQDRVPYDVWHKSGHLNTTPGRSIEYQFIARYIVKQFEQRNIKRIAFDRWNMRHLKPWLVHAGMSESFIADRFVDFGQGFVSMSPALRNLESILLSGNLRHGAHPVMQMCAANAVVKMDEAGNRKLDKKKSRGRIDGMVSLAMACALANEESSNRPIFANTSGERIAIEDIVEDLS
jgi:phage terminase large subunit-like protein